MISDWSIPLPVAPPPAVVAAGPLAVAMLLESNWSFSATHLERWDPAQVQHQFPPLYSLARLDLVINRHHWREQL